MTSYVVNTVNRRGLSKLKFLSELLTEKSFTRWETLFEVLLALSLALGIFVISFKAFQHGFDSYNMGEAEQKPVRAEYSSPFQIQQNNEKWPRQLPHLFTARPSASEGK